MAGPKKRARKCLASDGSNLHANNSASNNTEPDTITHSYRPGQERGKDPSYLNDQPMQDVPKTENPSKRRKAVDGDFYRPSLRPRPLPPYERPPESDGAFLHDLAAYELTESPPPTKALPANLSEADKLPERRKKKERVVQLRSNIQRIQKQLPYIRHGDPRRIDTERLLAGFQAALKALNDLPAKNNPKTRYHVARANERQHAQKALNTARAKEGILQSRLKILRDRLEKDVPVTVSDDEEEGGVSLTQGSATDDKHAGRERHRRRARKHLDELLADPAYAQQRQSELEKKLEEARQDTHIAEVDANYCCFAPLDQQYICLFPTDKHGRVFGLHKKAGKQSGMPEVDPEKELQKDFQAGILRTNLGSKPPLWVEIEEKMKAGSFKGLADTLGLGVDEHSLTEVGGKIDALERAMVGSTLKRRHSWMDNDEIAPEDLDSESESESNSEDDDEDDDDEM
jgi:hypothetical protein